MLKQNTRLTSQLVVDKTLIVDTSCIYRVVGRLHHFEKERDKDKDSV